MGIFSKSRKEADSGGALPLVHKGFEFEATPNSKKIALFSDEGQLFINRVREEIDEVCDITNQMSIDEINSKISVLNKKKIDFSVELKYVLVPFRLSGFHFLIKLSVKLSNVNELLSERQKLVDGIKTILLEEYGLTFRSSMQEVMEIRAQFSDIAGQFMLDLSIAKSSFNYKGFDFVMYFRAGYGYLHLLLKDQELVTLAGRTYVDEKLTIENSTTVEEIEKQIQALQSEDESWSLSVEIYPIPFSHQGHNFIIKVLLNSEMAEASFSTPRDVFIGSFREAIDQLITINRDTTHEELVKAISEINNSLEDIWLELIE